MGKMNFPAQLGFKINRETQCNTWKLIKPSRSHRLPFFFLDVS